MTEEPLVSVVVPTYNRPKRLRRALNSINKQSYDHIETIVVDDCSDTSAKEVINDSSYDMDIIHIRHKHNKGANAARNTGIKRAKGDYIAFLDDDDTWKNDKIERQVRAIENRGVGVVYTGVQHIDSDGLVQKRSLPESSGKITTTLLRKNVVGSFSVVLVDAECIEEVGLPDEEFPIWQDKEWYIRLSTQYEFSAISDILVNHYSDQETRISDDFDGLALKTLPMFLNKFNDNIQKHGILSSRIILSDIYYSVGRYALATGNFEECRQYSVESMKRNPLNYRSLACFILSLNDGILYNKYKQIQVL